MAGPPAGGCRARAGRVAKAPKPWPLAPDGPPRPVRPSRPTVGAPPDTPRGVARLAVTMETMHAGGRRTLPPVPRAPRGRAAGTLASTARSARALRTRSPGRRPAVRRPAAGGSDDFARRGGAVSAVVPEAVPPARHRRARCRVVLRYADDSEADVTFVGAGGTPGSPSRTGSTAQIRRWLAAGQLRDDAWLVADIRCPRRRGRRSTLAPGAPPTGQLSSSCGRRAVRRFPPGRDGPRWGGRPGTGRHGWRNAAPSLTPGAAHGRARVDMSPGRGRRRGSSRSAAMTAIAPQPIISRPSPAHGRPQGLPAVESPAHDRPQDHRSDVPDDVVRLLHHRRPDGHADPGRAGAPGAAVPVAGAVQPAVHHARHVDAADVRDTAVLRVRQPDHAAADRLTRRRVPPAERTVVLAVPVRQHDRGVEILHPRWRRRTSGGRPTPRCPTSPTPRAWARNLWIGGLAVSWPGHDPRCRQLHHHDRLPPRSRHDDVPDADLHLEHPGHQHPGPPRLPDPDRGDLRTAGRPEPGRPRLLPRERRAAAVAAPVLVLRAPRGLHHRPALLRHRHRDHPGLHPQAAVRLQGHGRRDPVDRLPLAGGLGAPHVRHRRRAAALLRVPDLPDRGAHRPEVLQLDRHHVARPADLRDARCCGRSASWSPSCSAA